MKRTDISLIYANPADFTEGIITVCGWVKTLRHSGAIAFLEISDGSCHGGIQAVINDSLNNFDEIVHQNVGAALIIKGNLILTPNAKQAFELHASEISVEGTSAPDYPLQKKRHSLEYLRTISHLRSRTNTFSAVFKVRSVAAFAIHKFFNERGFIYAHTPLITASDCEGAGEMFRVTTLDAQNPPTTKEGKVDFSEDFFGKPAGLTVSGQLEAESMAMAFGKVYTFGPTFRAE
ncbi:MAG: amino acid--tRNA ligase-related protein, partial [Oscillospiraceae bacterium]